MQESSFETPKWLRKKNLARRRGMFAVQLWQYQFRKYRAWSAEIVYSPAMSIPFSLQYIDGDSPIKRRARIEIVGKTFMLFEQEWRSGPYFFGDLVYRGQEGEAQVFGLDDGIKARPKWQIRLKGDVPPELAALLPKQKSPMLSGVGLLIVAFLCLGIVYFAAA
jgi:hypothetical protein